jgi:hypothetical protein
MVKRINIRRQMLIEHSLLECKKRYAYYEIGQRIRHTLYFRNTNDQYI